MIKEDEFTKELFRRQMKIRRSVGGFAWPVGDKPGFLCVVTEDVDIDRAFNEHHLRVREEFEGGSLNRLFERAENMKGRWMVDYWAADTGNLLRVHLDEWNRDRLDDRCLYLTQAPYADDPAALSFYVQTVKDILRADRTLLHFEENSRIPAALMALTPDDVSRKAADFPPIFALAAAVCALRLRPYHPPEIISDEEEPGPFMNLDRMLKGESPYLNHR